jgi:polysaccharide biosynthesis/export protein
MSISWIALLLSCVQCFGAQQPSSPREVEADQSSYILGPGDEISIRVLDSTDIPDKPIRVDSDGQIALPLAGRIQAAGKSVAVLETEITNRLQKYIISPQVSVNVTDFGSQPVSVLGAVTAPGVYQLSGTKPLAQVIALAKGFAPDAGGQIRIASYQRSSTPPEAGAVDLGNMSVTEVSVEELLSSSSAVGSILIRPHDVITVPKAHLVYVIGEVHKPGAHILSNRDSISVLEAISMAEGILPTASPQHARLLRLDAKAANRVEIPLDLKRILAGRADNVMLQPNDILLIPNNAVRAAGLRTIEAAIQLGTGILIWHRP